MIRYLFLLFGGIYLCEKGIVLTMNSVILSVVSIIAIFLFEYTTILDGSSFFLWLVLLGKQHIGYLIFTQCLCLCIF